MKKKSTLFFAVIALILYTAYFIPFIMSANTGIPVNKVVIDDLEGFSDTDVVLAFLFIILPAVGLFIACLLRGKIGWIVQGIGILLLILSIVIYRIYDNADETSAYIIFAFITLIVPNLLKTVGKRWGGKGVALCVFSPIIIGVLINLIIITIYTLILPLAFFFYTQIALPRLLGKLFQGSYSASSTNTTLKGHIENRGGYDYFVNEIGREIQINNYNPYSNTFYIGDDKYEQHY